MLDEDGAHIPGPGLSQPHPRRTAIGVTDQFAATFRWVDVERKWEHGSEPDGAGQLYLEGL
jgi:hypothetical protein